MGKATVISHLGDAQYSVRLSLDQARYQQEAATLAARIAALQTRIDDPDEKENPETLALVKTSLELRLRYLQDNLAADPVVDAWCADLTTTLSGEVGTIEVPGERGAVLVRPGNEDAAAYAAARDGRLQHPLASTPAGVFFNWALLPWWQKYKPTHRFALITAIDHEAHTCSLSLEAAASTAQSIDINQAAALSGVPISYMWCNSLAFEVGDSVLVEFAGQAWGSPRVIGFKEEPKRCKTLIVRLWLDDDEDNPTRITGADSFVLVEAFWRNQYGFFNRIGALDWDADLQAWKRDNLGGSTAIWIFTKGDWGLKAALDSVYAPSSELGYRWDPDNLFLAGDGVPPGEYDVKIPLFWWENYSYPPFSYYTGGEVAGGVYLQQKTIPDYSL